MTNRTKELFDFAQNEPEAVHDFRMMLRDCGEEELEHVETVARNLTAAAATRSEIDEDEFGETID
jgi:Mn-containing catalase